MTVSSLPFALFVIAVLPVYYCLGRRAQNWWLLLCSYVFYGLVGRQLPVVLLVVTLGNYLLARSIRTAGPTARWWFSGAVAADVLTLVLLRHTGVVGTGQLIGVSFYTMQAISYLADVRSGRLAGPIDPVDFALYLAYFPRLIAGPIERAGEFLPRLAAPRIVDNAAIAEGVTLIVVGVVRTFVLAEPLAALVPSGMLVAPSRFPPGVLVAGITAGTFWLYNGFAGYTSIVRGVSALFGIPLSPNFIQPFFSRSFSELWSRWHVSLTRWLRDYIYLPLTRALLRRDLRRWNVAAIALPPFAALMASGFWHGGGAGMLLWGALHGMFLTCERIWSLWRPSARTVRRAAWRQILAILAVFALDTLALVPFLAGPGIALEFWGALFRREGWGFPDTRLLVLVAGTFALDVAQYAGAEDTAFLRWPRPVQAALLAGSLVAMFVMSETVRAPFIYQGF